MISLKHFLGWLWPLEGCLKATLQGKDSHFAHSDISSEDLSQLILDDIKDKWDFVTRSEILSILRKLHPSITATLRLLANLRRRFERLGAPIGGAESSRSDFSKLCDLSNADELMVGFMGEYVQTKLRSKAMRNEMQDAFRDISDFFHAHQIGTCSVALSRIIHLINIPRNMPIDCAICVVLNP